MAVNPLFLNSNQAKENKTIPELVPLPVALLIFKNLQYTHMIICSKGSRGLRELCSRDEMWKPIAQLVGLRVVQTPFNTEPVVTSEYKLAVGCRAVALKACIATVDPVLDIKVRKAYEFDQAVFGGEDRASLEQELDQKVELHQRLDQGMAAHCYLRRMGMSTTEKLVRYATVLQEYYGTQQPWCTIAQEHVREGDFEKAIAIIDGYLNTKEYSSEREHLFNMMISELSQAGDFRAAMTCLKKSQTYESYRGGSNESLNIILCYAEAKGDETVALEMLEEGLIPEREKTTKIYYLLRAYLKKGLHQDARTVLKKHEGDLRKKSNEFELHELIRIYVELGHNQQAWDIASTIAEQDNRIFYILRNAFNEKGLLAEAEKAEALIKK